MTDNTAACTQTEPGLAALPTHRDPGPSLLNSDPFGRGWLVKIRTTDPSPLDALMDQAMYDTKYPAA